jgi:hypothetical protein
MKVNSIFLLCQFFICVPSFGQVPKIAVSFDRYQMRIMNNYKYSLKGLVMKDDEVLLPYTLLKPGEDKPFCVLMNSKKINSVVIKCKYDIDTYKKDTLTNLNNYNIKLKEINDLEDKKRKNADYYLATKAAIEYFLDDGWVKSTFKTGTNIIDAIKKNYKNEMEIHRIYNEIKNKDYSLSEIFEQIKMKIIKKFYQNILEKLINVIETIVKEIHTKYPENKFISQYMKNGLLTWIDEHFSISEEIDDLKNNAYLDYETTKNELKSLLDSSSFTSNNTYPISKYYKIKKTYFENLSPEAGLIFETFFRGNNLNEYWKLSKPTFSIGYFHWVSPEIIYKRQDCTPTIYSRFFLEYTFRSSNLTMIEDKGLKLSSNFFKNTTTGRLTISKPLEFNLYQHSFGIIYRTFINNNFTFDLGGGLFLQRGILRLSNSELSNGYTWAIDKIKITQQETAPFGCLRIGYVYRMLEVHLGYHIFKSNLRNNTNYTISDGLSNKVNFNSSGQLYWGHIGLIYNLKK